jgi:hypothetical protein
VSCGPVAAVNSFVFLQNQYPDIYGTALSPPLIKNGSLADTAIALAGPDFMGCRGDCGGVSAPGFFSGKQKWINGTIGKTVFSFDPNFSMPTLSIDGLVQDLMAKQDTELLMGFFDADGNRTNGHFVTLFSLTTGADGSSMGVIDPVTGEGGFHDYTVGADGVIHIADFGVADARLEFVFDESPVPGPVVGAGVPGLIAACAGLLGWARRRRNAGLPGFLAACGGLLGWWRPRRLI